MNTLVTDDVLFILAKSEQYFCQILHLITSRMEIRQKSKYIIDISQNPLQGRKKGPWGKRALFNC